MARATRRSSAKSSTQTPPVDGEPENTTTAEGTATPTPPASQDVTRAAEQTEPPTSADTKEERCPACTDESIAAMKVAAAEAGTESVKESWVRCDACKSWYHWRCAGEGDLEAVGKWFCKACRDVDPRRVITMKPPARKSARKRVQRDYAGLNAGNEQDPDRWHRMMQGKTIKPDPFKRMQGADVSVEWLETDPTAMTEPIVIELPEGLGMEMPEDITVADVAEIVGPDTPVEVIDVASQSNLPGWTLGKWADYYGTEPAKREKVRNVISLEISGTELADKVLPPRLVRDVDWVEKFWPATKKGRGHVYPKVQLYCLMGVEKAWTDWHVDFAGSSVYYHILRGSKVFYFIRPTPANLAAYERWSGTEVQNHQWLGDLCDEVFKVELHAGNTMIIPTGWIHAVYTPEDTLVFGGNFLHSYNVATQLKIRDIEIATHVPKKFRFPLFSKLCWYAGEKYLRDLKAKEEFPQRVLDSVEVLSEFLVAEARVMEKGTDHAKREAKEQVPGDRIKDAPAMARELRWRVRLAGGYESDDDGRVRKSAKTKTAAVHHRDEVNGAGKKRKRTEGEEPEDEIAVQKLFMHFKPKSWDAVTVGPAERSQRTAKMRRPDLETSKYATRWSALDMADEEGDMEEAVVDRRRDVLVKVRRTAKGLERQRVERILEEWSWDDMPAKAETSGPETVVQPDHETNGTSAVAVAAQDDVKMDVTPGGEPVAVR